MQAAISLPGRHLLPPSARTLSSLRHRPLTFCMALSSSRPSVVVMGITDAVGQEFLRVLSDQNFPYCSIRMLASRRSAGQRLTFDGREHVVEEVTPDSFDGVDLALFSADSSVSRELAPATAARGCVVVDNSSVFRMDPQVPLVIPEVNPEAIAHIKLGKGGGAIIANPNCSTIICLVAATPLHRHAKYAFNLFSHNAPIQENGYNEEEMKMVKETRKIWNDPLVKVTASCIRVPVMHVHAESINLQFGKPLDEANM